MRRIRLYFLRSKSSSQLVCYNPGTGKYGPLSVDLRRKPVTRYPAAARLAKEKDLRTYMCPGYELAHQWLSALLQGIENQGQGTGAVPQIQKLLQEDAEALLRHVCMLNHQSAMCGF